MHMVWYCYCFFWSIRLHWWKSGFNLAVNHSEPWGNAGYNYFSKHFWGPQVRLSASRNSGITKDLQITESSLPVENIGFRGWIIWHHILIELHPLSKSCPSQALLPDLQEFSQTGIGNARHKNCDGRKVLWSTEGSSPSLWLSPLWDQWTICQQAHYIYLRGKVSFDYSFSSKVTIVIAKFRTRKNIWELSFIILSTVLLFKYTT